MKLKMKISAHFEIEDADEETQKQIEIHAARWRELLEASVVQHFSTFKELKVSLLEDEDEGPGEKWKE